MANKPYERINFRGKALNRRTAAMIEQAERILGYELHVMQGSYNRGGVSASAGTHDGGGAVDIAWPSSSRKKADEVVKALRRVGFAVWRRDTLPGEWNQHIHAIAIGDKEMSSGAAKQVQDYYHGLDGLAGHRRDSTWRPGTIPRFSYPLGVLNLDVAIQQARAKKKASKPAVKVIQTALNAVSGTHLVADGIYGAKTKAAVARWEKQNGGDGDGIPGSYAMKLLGASRFRVQ